MKLQHPSQKIITNVLKSEPFGLDTVDISQCDLAPTENIVLSDEQNKALDFIVDFLKSNKKQIVISGCAGTGKSSIIPEIIKISGFYSTEVVAYTGKAVVVLKRKGINGARTLHSLLYEKKSKINADGTIDYVFVEKSSYSFCGTKLVIVDEASMLDKNMYELLNKHPFKVIYIGDHFQLPPISDNFNIMERPDFVMTEILRQLKDDPIVMLAERARNGLQIPHGTWGDTKKIYGIKKEILPLFSQIITWTNNKKNTINDAVRLLKGITDTVPMKDEKMIVKSNNKCKNVFNGQMIYLVDNAIFNRGFYKVEFIDELAHDDIISMVKYGKPTKARATLRLDKKEMEKYFNHKPSTSKEESIKYKIMSETIHLDYGYAITCHASQGSSWENVCIVEEPRLKHMDFYNRWLYTAITRAERALTIYSGDVDL